MKHLIEINQIPPSLCRLMARKRHGNKAMSHADIARVSGLAKCTVIRISKMSRWDNLPLKTIIRYSMACGVNLMKPKEAIYAFRRCNMAYIRKCEGPQKKLYARLFADLSNNGCGRNSKC